MELIFNTLFPARFPVEFFLGSYKKKARVSIEFSASHVSTRTSMSSVWKIWHNQQATRCWHALKCASICLLFDVMWRGWVRFSGRVGLYTVCEYVQLKIVGDGCLRWDWSDYSNNDEGRTDACAVYWRKRVLNIFYELIRLPCTYRRSNIFA